MRKLYYLLIFIFSFSVLSAQEKLSKEEQARREKNIQAGNPFAKYGYKAKVATLSKGKYLEFHDLDSIVTIGTIRWHVDKNQIVGRIKIDTLNPDAQPIGDAPGRWMSPDPLSEEFPSYSPYNFCFNNPMRYTDPDGRAPFDWIKNNKTGGFEWRNEVTSASNTPKGYSYVGRDDSSIVNNLFGKSNFRTSDWDFGTISGDDFDNPYSASGAAVYHMKTETTMSTSFSADVKTQYNDSGGIKSKEFRGLNISTSISGETVAPYPNIGALALRGDSMTLQGKQMGDFKPSPFGNISQGGDVPTLNFQSYWGANSIQNSSNKSFNLNFSFKGVYFDTESLRSLSAPTMLGVLPIENTTSLNLSVPVKN